MKIKMIKDTSGSINGYTIIDYKANQVYKVDGKEINEFCAKSFLKRGLAKIEDNKPTIETKVPAIENKAIQKVEVTKSEQLEDLAEEVEEELEDDFKELKKKAIDLGLNVGSIKKVSTLKAKIEDALKEKNNDGE